MTRTFTRLLVAGLLLSGLVWAQEEDDSNDGGESTHGVARVSLMNGDVSVQRGDNGDTVAAIVNAPLQASDHVLTGPSARAEIQFDAGTYLRLGTDTEVRMASLENNRAQVQLGRGTVTLAVIRDSGAQIEIDTPNMAFRPTQRGAYRVSVTDDGQTEVTVRGGTGETYTPKGTEAVQAGETMIVRGSMQDPEFQVVQAIAMDEWDRWNQQRDQRLLSVRSYQYMSPDIPGGSDLDSNGQWQYDAPYGWVWSPSNVGPDWAPYRDGRWTYLDYYGWSWVGYEPWGWAPYHYGRWFDRPGFGWCWYPGPVYQHAYWRPGLVSFFGFGHGGVGVGIGFGGIGWVPLGPHEGYRRWYGRGGVDIHVTNVTNLRNTYINARAGNGISSVNATEFGRGSRPGALHLTGREQMSEMRGQLPVRPTSASFHMTDRSTRLRPGISARTQFYSPRSTPGGAAPAARGWRQVSPSQSFGQAPRTSRPATRDWRTFGQAPQRTARPQYQPQTRTYQNGQAPRYNAPRSEGVRINPPIVRERSQSSAPAPRSSGGGGGGSHPSGGGGGGHAAPSGHSSGGSGGSGGHSSGGGQAHSR